MINNTRRTPPLSVSLYRICGALTVIMLIWVTLNIQKRMNSHVVYSEGSPDWDPHACIPYVANITATWTHSHGDISLADIEAGLDNFKGALPEVQPLPKYPDWNKPVGINDVLGPWINGRPAEGQWRHPFHILWVDGQTNKNCPTCRLCMHKLQVLVKSFLATQDLSRCSLIVHTDDVAGLRKSSELRALLPYFQIVPFDMHAIAKDTEFEDQWVLDVVDSKAYLTGDLFRMLVLYRYGGIYVDFDSILFSDFGPMLGKEFWARWECTTDMSPGIMSFHKNGTLATLVFRELTQTKPEADTYKWGTDLITRIYYELGADHPLLKDLLVAPACYFYPEWCWQSHGPYFSSSSIKKPLFLGGFAYHWHGGGGKRFELPVGHGSQWDRTEEIIDEKLKIRFGWKAASELIRQDETFDKYAPPPVCKRYDHPTNWMSPKYTRWLRIPFALMMFALFVQFCLSADRQVRVKEVVKQFFTATFETILAIWLFIVTIFRLIFSLINAIWVFLKSTWAKQSGKICIIVVIGVPALYGLWFITRPPDCGFGRSTGGYSIALYHGASLRDLAPSTPNQPVLTAHDVTDRSGIEWLADPFLVVEKKDGANQYHLFFEAISYWGEIGHATSTDGKQWTYQSIVLSEPGFHLSFPFVFQYDGTWYMMPETGAVKQVRLYRAVEFPSVWIYQGTIFEGNYIDSTMFEYHDRWWLFLWDNHGSNVGSLSIYYTTKGDSPVIAANWHAHVMNPVISRSYMRPAGRPVVSDQDITGNGVKGGPNLYRFVMDNTRTYGERVYMMQITTLTTTSFEEIQLDANGPPAKFLRGTGTGWNSNSMHHVDAHQLSKNEWIAAVDGCGHAPYTTSRSSLHLLSAMNYENDGEPTARARAATNKFTTASVPSSIIMDESSLSDSTNNDDDSLVHTASPSSSRAIPLSYSMSSGHVPLAARQDGVVVIVAVTQPQFFALTYLLDTLRSAQAQVVVYDMGLSADQVSSIRGWPLLTYRKFDFTRFPAHFAMDSGVKAWKSVIIGEVIEEIYDIYRDDNVAHDTNINVLWIEAGGLIANLHDAVTALRAAPYGILIGATSDTIGHYDENASLLKPFGAQLSDYATRSVVDSSIIGISLPLTDAIDAFSASPSPSAHASTLPTKLRPISLITSKKRESIGGAGASLVTSSVQSRRNIWNDIISPWRTWCMAHGASSSSLHRPDQVVLSYLLHHHLYSVSKIDSDIGIHQQCDRAFYRSFSPIFDTLTLPPSVFQYWCLA